MVDQDILDFLEHHGVKGQKWGVRRAEKRSAKGPDRFGNRKQGEAQRRVDRVKRVASGKASVGDMFKAGLLNIPLKDILIEASLSGGAEKSLERSRKNKRKIVAGKRNATDILSRIGGIDIREINLD